LGAEITAAMQHCYSPRDRLSISASSRRRFVENPDSLSSAALRRARTRQSNLP
jgi:hypothetical protein